MNLKNLIPYAMSALGIISLATLYIMQYGFEITPCLLCYPQRWCLMAVTLLYVGISMTPMNYQRVRFLLGWLAVLFCFLGSLIAGRHLWLQWQPPGKINSCGVSLDYMMEHLPMVEVILQSLSAKSDCHMIKWQLFSISMPGWSLLLFTCFSIITGYWVWVNFKAPGDFL